MPGSSPFPAIGRALERRKRSVGLGHPGGIAEKAQGPCVRSGILADSDLVVADPGQDQAGAIRARDCGQQRYVVRNQLQADALARRPRVPYPAPDGGRVRFVDKTLQSAVGAMLRRRVVTELLGPKGASGRLALTVITFGFKNGPPREADLLLDVRFLPNPHYREDLRPLTGRDQRVVEYVEAGDIAAEFYERLFPLLDFVLPAYVTEGKTHLTIAIGCTGGKHRPVALTEELREHIAGLGIPVAVAHRDLGKE
jgi:hypothetical protein